jgi:hypothetical protein
MAISRHNFEIIESFRQWLAEEVARAFELGAEQRLDRADSWRLCSQWQAEKHLWLAVLIHPTFPQVKIGLMTDDSCHDRDLADMVEASGMTLQELVVANLKRANIDWSDPPVEHYCEKRSWYFWTTPIELTTIEQLEDSAIRERVFSLAKAYHTFKDGHGA